MYVYIQICMYKCTFIYYINIKIDELHLSLNGEGMYQT